MPDRTATDSPTTDDRANDLSRAAAPVAAALKSGSGRARHTRLIAKAKGNLASEILEIARACDIPIHSDADLAEILIAIEEDTEIPLGALAAVAEILNYLYQRQRAGTDEGEEIAR